MEVDTPRLKVGFLSDLSDTILAVAHPLDLDAPGVVERIEALAGRDRSFVRHFSFDDPVKRLCVEYLGLTWSQVYSRPDDPVPHLPWERMPIRLRPGWRRGPLGLPLPCIRKGPMTSSEVMRHVAHGMIGRIDPDAWIRCTMAEIERWFVDEAKVRMDRRRLDVRDETSSGYAIVDDVKVECVQPSITRGVSSYDHLVAIVTDCWTTERVDAVLRAGGEFLDPGAIAEEESP